MVPVVRAVAVVLVVLVVAVVPVVPVSKCGGGVLAFINNSLCSKRRINFGE